MRRRIRHNPGRALDVTAAATACALALCASAAHAEEPGSAAASLRADRVAELNVRLAEQDSTCRVLSELPARTRLSIHCRRDEPLELALESPELCQELEGLGIDEVFLVRPGHLATCDTTAPCTCAPRDEAPDWVSASAAHRRALTDALNAHWGPDDCRATLDDDDADTDARAVSLTCLDLTVTDTIGRFVSSDAACPTWRTVDVDTVRVTALDGIAACRVDADCRCAAELAPGSSLTGDQRRTLLRHIERIESLLDRGAPQDALTRSATLLRQLESRAVGEAPLVALALSVAARTALALGDAPTALELQTRAVESVAAGLGEDHPTPHRARCALAATELAVGDPDAALETANAARSALEDRVGAEHIAVLRCRLTAARAEMTLGRSVLGELEWLAATVDTHPHATPHDRFDALLARVRAERLAGQTARARARLDAWTLPAEATSAQRATLQVERAWAALADRDPDAALDALLVALDRVGAQDTTVLQVVLHDVGLLAGVTRDTAADAARVATELGDLVDRLEPPPVTAATVELAVARWALHDGRAEHALGVAERAAAVLVERGLEHTPEALGAARITARARLALGDATGAVEHLVDAVERGSELHALLLRDAPRPVRRRQADALAAVAETAWAIALAAPDDARAVELAARAALAWSDLPRRVDDHPVAVAGERARLVARLQPTGADLVAATRTRRDTILAHLTDDTDAPPAWTRHTDTVAADAMAALPERTAWVMLRRAAAATGGLHDLALVVRHDGVALVDLGPAQRLDAAVGAFTALDDALACVGQASFEVAARTAHEVVLEPLEHALQGVDHLIFDATGPAAALPWPALTAADGHRVVERYRVSALDRVEELVAPSVLEGLWAPDARCASAGGVTPADDWLVPRVEAELSPGPAGPRWTAQARCAAPLVVHSAARPRIVARRASAAGLIAELDGLGEPLAALHGAQIGALSSGTETCAWPWAQVEGDWRGQASTSGPIPGAVEPNALGCGCSTRTQSGTPTAWSQTAAALLLVLLSLVGLRRRRREMS